MSMNVSLPSSALRERVLAAARSAPSKTRASRRREVAILVVAGSIATTALFFVMGGFAPGTRPLELVAFTAGFALLAALVLTRLSGSRPGSMLARPASVLVTVSVAAAPILAACALAASVIWPESAAEDVQGRADVNCALMTLVQGALPLVVLLAPRKGAYPVNAVVTGAALGMTAGAWTAMMAYLRCPHAAPSHCIVAHVVPTIVLTALGALLGRALLRLR